MKIWTWTGRKNMIKYTGDEDRNTNKSMKGRIK